MLDQETDTTLRTRAECERCRKTLDGSSFEVRTSSSSRLRCLTCALTFGPLVRRSAIVALIVGTILTAINQGNHRRRFPGVTLLEDPAHLRGAVLCSHDRRDSKRP